MKKLALLALTLPVLGFTFMACTDAGDPYIPPMPEAPTATDVDLMVNDTVGQWDDDGLYVRGDLTGGNDVNMTQDGTMWMVTVDDVAAGSYTYGIYSDDGSKAEMEIRAGLAITVGTDLGVSGDTDVDVAPTAETGFRLIVTNNNTAAYDNIKIKGAYDGWATTDRDGQSADGVTVYRNIPAGLEDGNYDWGVIHDDGTESGIWLLPGPNLQFTMAAGAASGEITFTIPAAQPSINLTLNCDMNDFLGTYEVVQVRGSFNDWDATPTTMTDDDADGIYSLTVEVEQNDTVAFKFITDGANYESVPSECGIDDGFGGYNRSFPVGTDDTSFTAGFGACPAGF